MLWEKLSISNMLKIFLIRHGETNYNKVSRIQGSIETDLNETGREQTQRLAKKLTEFFFNKNEEIYFYYSPQLRAKNTFKIIYKYFLDSNIVIKDHKEDSRLREIHCGDWEGKLFHDLEKYYPDILFHIRTKVDFPYPSGESIEDIFHRVKPFWDELLVENHNSKSSKNIIIVSHGNLLRTLSSYILRLPLEFSLQVILNNTGMSYFEERFLSEEYKTFKLIRWNDLSHLL